MAFLCPKLNFIYTTIYIYKKKTVLKKKITKMYTKKLKREFKVQKSIQNKILSKMKSKSKSFFFLLHQIFNKKKWRFEDVSWTR